MIAAPKTVPLKGKLSTEVSAHGDKTGNTSVHTRRLFPRPAHISSCYSVAPLSWTLRHDQDPRVGLAARLVRQQTAV